MDSSLCSEPTRSPSLGVCDDALTWTYLDGSLPLVYHHLLLLKPDLHLSHDQFSRITYTSTSGKWWSLAQLIMDTIIYFFQKVKRALHVVPLPSTREPAPPTPTFDTSLPVLPIPLPPPLSNAPELVVPISTPVVPVSDLLDLHSLRLSMLPKYLIDHGSSRHTLGVICVHGLHLITPKGKFVTPVYHVEVDGGTEDDPLWYRMLARPLHLSWRSLISYYTYVRGYYQVATPVLER
ncbi:hypothetical protein CK203_045960 [Vitis vinifera]|uniref:Uncharacterized protein n=1 Tax=Vitis vinifera TaxID=29760 RepID=A0A438I524_VITVI|nr:hypothetical protein CK203_045960 [Vitis vinifera]